MGWLNSKWGLVSTTQWAHHVESTSIRRRYYVDTWKTKFDEFPRHFHVLFRCNFANRKIHDISMYFFRRSFTGWKILVNSTYFFGVILLLEKSSLFPRILFDVILMFEKSTLFPRTFFDVISMFEIVRYFYLLFST